MKRNLKSNQLEEQASESRSKRQRKPTEKYLQAMTTLVPVSGLTQPSDTNQKLKTTVKSKLKPDVVQAPAPPADSHDNDMQVADTNLKQSDTPFDINQRLIIDMKIKESIQGNFDDKTNSSKHKSLKQEEKTDNECFELERVNDDETLKSSSSEELLDISETFITIETKDGLSSERIPFSHFLQKFVIDKASGNVKIDLAQLLTSNDSLVTTSNKSILVKAFPEFNEKNTPSASSSQEPMQNIDTKVGIVQPSSVFSENPTKRRGRPPKQKKNIEITPKPENLHKVRIPAKNSDYPQIRATSDFTSKPRRSNRTPAKNSRFGDDYVDSITLGKVSSSVTVTPSTWNTQLMTLALAAERHKNKPSKLVPAKGTIENGKSYNGQFYVVNDSSYNDNATSVINPKSENLDEKYSHTINIEKQKTTTNKISVLDEELKKSGIRGPKTLKKYEAVNPVMKRSLHEALNHTLETTKVHLSPSKPLLYDVETANKSAYYTIMEPKIEPNGHGLLIQKDQESIKFKIVNFNGCLQNGLPQVSQFYPQDRYFSCDVCDQIFQSSSTWLLHNKYQHNRAIDSFENSTAIQENNEFTCDFCRQKFPYKFMLDIHIKRKRHSEIKSFRCTLCKEGFVTHKEREVHWMMSHPARSCALCGKQFTNIVMLRRHINNNCHGARFRKRPVSEEMSAEEKMVISQDKAMHIAEESDNGDEASKETEAEEDDDANEEDECGGIETDTGRVRCQTCCLQFTTYSGLWHHKLEEHAEFYPEGFKETLKDKLKRNDSALLNADDAEIHNHSGALKNRFYVIMRPEWPPEKPNLTISVVDKDFLFKVKDSKTNTTDTLPQNSYADAPPIKETTFECAECGEYFQYASNYREHRSRVHGECFEILRLLGAFQCTLCSETYPCQFMLDKHLKKHIGKKELPCTLCGVVFHKIQERRLHWKTAHPGIGCPNCGKMYASIKYLQKHISLNCQDHFPPTKKFLEFQKRQHSDFEMNKNEKKVEKKIIKCHLCPKICSSIHGWRRHMSESHEDAGFSKLSNTCIICNELVYGYKALEKHLLQNHAVDSGLPVEEEEGLVEEALKKCEVDIASYRKAGKTNTDIYQDEEGNYHCPSCPKVHSDIKALRTHIRIHVNMKLECVICHKDFKNHILLRQHVQRHRKKAVYTCETCKKNFLTLQKLNKHRKVHHNGGKFVCELCGISFALNDYLQKHKRCHTDKKPHSCTICCKTFRTKPELKVHVLIHTKETPFKCQFCDRGFSQKGNYRIHLSQHTGDKPYQCDQCEISFALKCHLKRHKITHDQKINYRCAWCDKECTQRKHMQMHVQRVHKEDFFQFEEHMKLETPIPIAPSQAKLYNRKHCKASKVRKQYKTRAKKCDSSIQQLLDGVVTKSEVMDDDEVETSQDIVIEPMVEQMIKAAHESGDYEILVSQDNQNFAKHTITAGLISHDTSNVEIVMGENNEINIIISDPSALHEVVDEHLEVDSAVVHETLQHAVEAFCHGKNVHEENDHVPSNISC